MELRVISLRRNNNSSKSLMTDFNLKPETMSRRGSVSSLKSLGKDMLSGFKKKDIDLSPEDEYMDRSNPFSQQTETPSRRSSVTSFKGFRKEIMSGFKKKEAYAPNNEDFDPEEEFMEKNNLLKKSKHFGRRLSSIFDSPLGKKLESGGRRHSTTTLSNISVISGISALQTQTHPVCFDEEEEQPQKPREAKRSDLPICWLDDTQHIKKLSYSCDNNTQDILSRLYKKVFTRHMWRKILSELDDCDIKNMFNVCISWRDMLNCEITKLQLQKILL